MSIRAACFFWGTRFPKKIRDAPRSPPDSVVLTPPCHSIIRKEPYQFGCGMKIINVRVIFALLPFLFVLGLFGGRNLIFIRLIKGAICIIFFFFFKCKIGSYVKRWMLLYLKLSSTQPINIEKLLLLFILVLR